MNYEVNTIRWKVGDLVLHDADHKSAEMLMEVVGYTKEGKCKTKYISDRYHRSGNRKDRATMKNIWVNSIEVLHDPARFGVSKEQL